MKILVTGASGLVGTALVPFLTTGGHRVVRLVRSAPEGEDVLEETPDFLQETPEHDRLWFEQKPPRDFDLDR